MDEGKAGNVLKTAVEKLKKRRNVDAMTVRLFLKGSPSPRAVAFWAPGGEFNGAEAGTPENLFKTEIKMCEAEPAGKTSEKGVINKRNYFSAAKKTRRESVQKQPAGWEAGASTRTVENRIMAAAAKKYPDKPRMQQYMYDQQLSAYLYLKAAEEADVKKIAAKKYPGDYPMQKYAYDQQLSAKKYMNSVEAGGIKQAAQKKYPDDYEMQKYIYDEQFAAKKYMESVADGAMKQAALKKFPGDYAMQKNAYDAQSAAKKYMDMALDVQAKLKAQIKYPDDYLRQKSLYDKLAAKNSGQ